MADKREHKNYEKTLPEGYEEAFVIDAKDKKTAVFLNIAAILIMAAILTAAVLIIKPSDFFKSYSFLRNLLLIAAMIAYMVLHELVHGAAYKLLTGQKLTFGLTLSVAYCGVPEIYVYRRAAIIALLAPFTVFLTLIIPVFFLENAWDKLYVMILFAMHIGGCAGDLYDTFLYLFRFKEPTVLMRDTGPKQTFYRKK